MMEYYILVNKSKSEKQFLKEQNSSSRNSIKFVMNCCDFDEATKYENVKQAILAMETLKLFNSNFKQLCDEGQIDVMKVQIELVPMNITKF